MTAATMTEVRERPILFSGAMVRAILEGRKTQTRRVVKLPANASLEGAVASSWDRDADKLREQASKVTDETLRMILGPRTEGAYLLCNLIGDVGVYRARSPYGQPGDRLWVRETWYDNLGLARIPEDGREEVYYRADPLPEFEGEEHGIPWRASIHMPRWASRLTLELTGVRVERLQEISQADAVAEGVGEAVGPASARDFYRLLWNELNAKRGFGWDANPWVWVLEFRRVEGGAR